MKQVLDMPKPYISHTPESSFIFSVLGEDKRACEWLYSYFLSMSFEFDKKADEFTWIGFYEIYKECPFLECSQIDYDDVDQRGVFTDFIEWMINCETYIGVKINKRYIPNYNCKKDFNHQMNIFGYDKKRESFI